MFLSCHLGTPMGQRLRLKLGGGGLERGKGVRESDRDKGFRGEETGLGDRDGADTSLRFVGLQNRGLAMRNYAEWALFSPDFSSLQSQWTARGTQRRLAVSGSREETMAESVSPSPPCQGSRGENLRAVVWVSFSNPNFPPRVLHRVDKSQSRQSSSQMAACLSPCSD